MGQGFVINDTNSYVEIPASSSLNVGAGPGLTLEAWIDPANVTDIHPIFQWDNGTNKSVDANPGVFLWINSPGSLFANLVDITGRSHIISTAANAISANAGFQHVALTYNHTTGVAVLYTNGVVAVTAGLGVFTPQTLYNLWLGFVPGNLGGVAGNGRAAFLGGVLDEPSVYYRALSASEIKAIYTLGGAGKFDPDTEITPPENLAEANVTIPGVNSGVIYGDNAWQTGGVTFTAISNQTLVIITGLEPGILLDNFSLSAVNSGNNLYYQPEQDMSAINNTPANGTGYPGDVGTWTLEIQDDRAGAGIGTLQSWQLGFTFANTNFTPGPSTLNGGQPQTNTVCSNSITWYQINVPATAIAATNILLFADAPVNVWYSTNNPPTTSNPGDVVLIPNTTGGSYTLTPATTPALAPGGTYYLGVQNTSGSCTTYAGEVDFYIPEISALTNGVPQTNSIDPGGVAYYSVTVPTNADFATNILDFATGPVNLWFNQNNLPVGANPPDYLLLGGATNGIGNPILGTSTTPPLVPGQTYYLEVQNTNSFAVTNAIEVDFHLVTSPIFILSIVYTNIGGTNGFLLTWYAPTNDEFLVQWTGNLAPPVTWNTFSNIVTYTGPPPPTNGIGQFTFFDDGSQTGGFDTMRFYRLILLQVLTNGAPQAGSVPVGGIDYFLINVPVNADFATNRLLSATGPLNLLFNQTTPPTGTNAGDYTLLAGVTSGSSILSTNSAPTNIVPGGTYWLGVQNTNSFAVSFSLEVDFHLLAGLPSIITLTNGIPYANSNSAAGSATDYYLYTVTTNAARVQFEVDNPSGDVTLAARFGLPLPGLTNFDYLSENPYTNGELIVVLTNSTPVALAPGDWYLAVVNISGAPVTYSVMATEWPVTGEPINIISTTVSPGDFCITWSSLPGAYYYVQGATDLTSTNWVAVSPTILATTNTTTYCVTLPSPYNFFRVVEGLAVNNYAPPPIISVTQTNGDFLLQWRGPATFSYQVQWASSLAPPISWNTVTNVLTSDTGLFTFLDDGSQTAPLGTMRFYQLIVLP